MVKIGGIALLSVGTCDSFSCCCTPFTGLRRLKTSIACTTDESGRAVIEVNPVFKNFKNHGTMTSSNLWFSAALTNNTEYIKANLAIHARSVDSTGQTALMIAAKHNCGAVATLLAPHESCAVNSEGKNAMIIAAERNNVGICRILLSHEVHATGPNGITPLMAAALHGSLDVVILLTPILWAKSDEGYKTALDYACLQDKLDVLKFMLDKVPSVTPKMLHSAKTTAINSNNEKALALLVAYENSPEYKAAAFRLQQRSVINSSIHGSTTKDKHTSGQDSIPTELQAYRDENGRSLLILAVLSGNDKAVQHLLGCSRVTDHQGMTALMYATIRNNTSMIKLLLPHEVTCKTKEGITALMYASYLNHAEPIKLLLPAEAKLCDGNGRTALMYAAFAGNVNAVRDLLPLEGGMCDKINRTALMYAAQRGNDEVVAVLRDLEAGMRTTMGLSALMIASFFNSVDCVKLLIEKEKQLQVAYDSRNALSGFTALMAAASNGSYKTASLLKEIEADMSIKNTPVTDGAGTTALMLAAQYGYDSIVKLLIAKEAGRYRESGMTALMDACSKGNYACVDYLRKAECGMKRNDGKCALILAVNAREEQCVRIMAKYEKKLRDSSGHTAEYHAKVGQFEGAIALLK